MGTNKEPNKSKIERKRDRRKQQKYHSLHTDHFTIHLIGPETFYQKEISSINDTNTRKNIIYSSLRL